MMSVTGSAGVGAGQGRRAGAGRRGRAQLRAGTARRTHRTASAPARAGRCPRRCSSSRSRAWARSPRATSPRARCPACWATHSPTFAPYGGFRTADGWIVAGRRGLRGPVGPLLRGARGWRAGDRPAVRRQRGPRRHRDELTAALRGRAHARSRRGTGWRAVWRPRACRPRRSRTSPRCWTRPQPQALGSGAGTWPARAAGAYRLVGARRCAWTWRRSPYPAPRRRSARDTRGRRWQSIGLRHQRDRRAGRGGVAIAP